jgi:7,8-dihydropterin-6-yl-methyl-4-(beta-D-ribofuranosyl)aminobenzene 5'-phosphate synthase
MGFSRDDILTRDLEVTVLYDNYVFNPELRTEWGFSCLVEGLEKIILFDTGGNGELLLSNMTRMGKDPIDVDVVVLSHGHKDHTGGLGSVLERNKDLRVFIPESLRPDHEKMATTTGVEFIPVGQGVAICSSAYSTGELGSEIKEQSLIVEAGEGLTVLTGCSHPGIVHILTTAKEMIDMPIDFALGGWHLKDLNRRRLRSVVREFRNLGVRNVAPCHCSGDETRELFADEYGDHFIRTGVGKVLEIPNGLT